MRFALIIGLLALAGCGMWSQTAIPEMPGPGNPGAAAAGGWAVTWFGLLMFLIGCVTYGLSFWGPMIWFPRTASVYTALGGVGLVLLRLIHGPVLVAGWIAVAVGGCLGAMYVVNVGVQLWDKRQASRGKNRLNSRGATRTMENNP